MIKEYTESANPVEDAYKSPQGNKYEINYRASSQCFTQNKHIKTFNFMMEVPMLRELFYNESGQDMVEYALLASFISIVAIGTLRLIGPLVSGIYDNVMTALS
jgi:Flp pilus assembly pilin Flp